MKTITHYDTPFLYELDSNVVEIKEENGKFWIALDETLFFPEGGGTPKDRGTINGIEVLDLKEDNGIIYHLLDKKIEGKVHLHLDEEYRFRRTQCHSCEHLISALFFDEYKLITPSAHYNTDGTCDIEVKADTITREQLDHIEKMANDIITQDLPFKISYLSKEEARKVTKNFDDYENLNKWRLVEIPGIDKDLCGCPHVPSSKFIKGVIITGAHKVKDLLRIDIICGDLLIEKSHEYYDEISNICNLLAAKRETVSESVVNLMNTFKTTNNRLYNYKTKYLDLYSDNKIKELDNSKINIILESHDDLEMKDLQFLVSKFSKIPNVIVIGILKKPDNTCNLMIAKNKDIPLFSAREIFKILTTKYEYRGGGSDVIAQGGGKIFDDIDNIVFSLVKEAIK